MIQKGEGVFKAHVENLLGSCLILFNRSLHHLVALTIKGSSTIRKKKDTDVFETNTLDM